MKKRKFIKAVSFIFFAFFLLGTAAVFSINAIVKHSVSEKINSADELSDFGTADCIVVLGCKVKNDGTPSDMLRDRLTMAVELYNSGAAPKILMSGDHGRDEYNEVGTMKQYAVDNGVPSEDVFMDHAGFSTYDTIYRVKEVFGAEKVIVVSQKYHLYRALYISEKLDLEARGIPADYHKYIGQFKRDIREVIARCKDAVKSLIKPEPVYLGEKISLKSSGDITND